ncbi:MAG: hypothetical protein J5863_07305 [Desulfovibrio sp.]|nr:hypothetical protein [Desulfovibrio sp.]
MSRITFTAALASAALALVFGFQQAVQAAPAAPGEPQPGMEPGPEPKPVHFVKPGQEAPFFEHWETVPPRSGRAPAARPAPRSRVVQPVPAPAHRPDPHSPGR